MCVITAWPLGLMDRVKAPQWHLSDSCSDGATTKQSDSPDCLAVADTDTDVPLPSMPAVGDLWFCEVQGLLPEALFWRKWVAKARQIVREQFLTSFFSSAREFWETASSVNSFTLSDFEDQWTVTMHSGKMWQNLRLVVINFQKCANIRLDL